MSTSNYPSPSIVRIVSRSKEDKEFMFKGHRIIGAFYFEDGYWMFNSDKGAQVGEIFDLNVPRTFNELVDLFGDK